MRITQHMLNTNMITNLHLNLARIAKYQEQIERETKINRPSDDPTGFSQTLSLQSNLNLNAQYQRNITNGIAWLSTADSSLTSIYEVLYTTRTNAIQGVDGILEQSNYYALAQQVDAFLDQIVTFANTSLGSTYLFAGKKNNFAPFIRIGDQFVYIGDTKQVLRDISPNGRFQVNVDGKKAFYDKLQNLVKGAGSTVKDLSITSQQFLVTSFGALNDADIAAANGGQGLKGSLMLNIDGRDFEIKFNGEKSAEEVVYRINSVIGLNGVAYCRVNSDNYLVIESKSANMEQFISVSQVDGTLSELKLLAGFNNLQYGQYQMSTIQGASPADSRALITDVYSQSEMRSSIVTNVGVVDPNNEYNSSVLMEIVEVNRTNDYAEIISSAPIDTANLDSLDGTAMEVVVDGKSFTVNFSGITALGTTEEKQKAVTDQINEALNDQKAAHLDANGYLSIRSQTLGVDSKIQFNTIDPAVEAILNFTDGQSGAVGITDATVRFTYHTYDKDGNRYDGTFVQKFEDVDPRDGLAGIPATVKVGEGLPEEIELALHLTGFIQTGDKAVISITARGEVNGGVMDDAILIDYHGQERKYFYNAGAADAGVQMKFFSLDVGNGEIYDGTIDVEFAAVGLGDAPNAASFTAGNIFDMMVYLRKKMENMEVDAIEQMEFYFDEMMDNMLKEQVTVGATTRQFEAVSMNYMFLEVNLGQMLSDYYATDMPKVTVRMQEVLNTYQASLYSSAMIAQTKLLDYLR